MDVSKYMAKGFIKPDDVRTPRQERIVNVYVSDRFDCVVIDLESGDQLSLNPFTTRMLGKAYGTESDNWLGHVIELSYGTYKKDNEDKDTIVVKPVSLPNDIGPNGKNPEIKAVTTKPAPSNVLDDEIPF
jgi:hypothetical protein